MPRMAMNIADLFEHAVDVVPDRGIIQVDDRIVTYAELEADELSICRARARLHH